MKLKQAFKAAYVIRKRKTKQGKRRAILNWCQKMKEALNG